MMLLKNHHALWDHQDKNVQQTFLGEAEVAGEYLETIESRKPSLDFFVVCDVHDVR